jgi:hypothetical protein
MMSEQEHWAKNIPVDEFEPLGQWKLDLLTEYVFKNTWNNGEDFIDPERIVNIMKENRRLASQFYTIHKKSIESMHGVPNGWDKPWCPPQIKKEMPKRKYNKKPKTKKKEPLPKNVISFEDYKKNKAS